MTRLATCAALAAAIVVGSACGGSVETARESAASGSGGSVPAAGGADGGPGGSGGYAGWGGTGGAPAGGSAGWGGAGGVIPADGGSPLCGETHEGFKMGVSTYDGQTWGCGYGGQTGLLKLQGQLTQLNGESYVLDSCPPNADCAPMFTNIELPGTTAWIPSGAFVTLLLEVQQPWGCWQRILINNLPMWGGVPNPNGSDSSMLFAAADGTYETFPESEFSIALVPQGCYPGMPGCGGEAPDDYLLQFSEVTAYNVLTVPMGIETPWMLSSGSYWLVKNLRSYSSGMCDDYWNWGYRLTRQGIK